jgi:hypothetical protein
MDVIVEELNPQYALWITNLTKKDILDAAESRLLAKQLYASSDIQKPGRSQILYVSVNTYEQAVSIDVSLRRYVENLGYGIPGFVEVWEKEAVGLTDGNGETILKIVGVLVDRFIGDYLRVNTYIKGSKETMGWCLAPPRHLELERNLDQYTSVQDRLREFDNMPVEGVPDMYIVAERRRLEEEACKLEEDIYGVRLSPWCGK